MSDTTPTLPAEIESTAKLLIGTLYVRHDLIPTAIALLPEAGLPGIAGRILSLFRSFGRRGQLDVAGFMTAITKTRGAHEYILQSQAVVLDPRQTYPEDVAGWADSIGEYIYKGVAVTTLTELIQEAQQEGTTLAAIIQEGILRLNAIGQGKGGTTWRTSQEVADSLIDLLSRWQEKGDEAETLTGIKTGFVTIDSKIVMMPNGQLIILAARPSQGKTAIVMQIAENVGKQFRDKGDNEIVAIFSAETGGEQLWLRLACAATGIPQNKLKKGKGTPEEYARVAEYVERMKALPIVVDESPNPTTDNMRLRLLGLHNRITAEGRQRVGLVIFDYAELAGDNDSSGEIDRMGNIARRLKGIAVLLNCPVILLCQVGRQVEARRDKVPVISDLRGSDLLSQIGYMILFIHRPSYYKRANPKYKREDDPEYNLAIVILAKHKDADAAVIRMRFIPELIRFEDAITPPPPKDRNAPPDPPDEPDLPVEQPELEFTF